MNETAKATKISLFNFSTPQMRAFHMSWFAFFLCFFAWFGIAPLMIVVRGELGFTPQQIKWCIIGSVTITIFARLFIGWLCDRIGPRLAYTWLLLIGSLPVIGIAFANSFETFLLFRILIGIIGASFVITQYHTTMMFASNCVGTANATTAGWGNLGGGVTQLVMPLLMGAVIGVFSLSDSMGWRVSMIIAGSICALTGVLYYFMTQDTPEGNFKELREKDQMPSKAKSRGSFIAACRDYRVWSLFVIYGACFGIELTINNIAAQYFHDYFGLSLVAAGMAAAMFGLMNIFARTLGGFIADKLSSRFGMMARVRWLFAALLCEGIILIFFSQITVLALAIPVLVLFSLFVQMSEGATFAVVPFINKKALGSVAGIVGAGGNAGAMAAGFLFGGHWPTALFIIGIVVTSCSFLALTVRFSPEVIREVEESYEAAKEERLATVPVAG